MSARKKRNPRGKMLHSAKQVGVLWLVHTARTGTGTGEMGMQPNGSLSRSLSLCSVYST